MGEIYFLAILFATDPPHAETIGPAMQTEKTCQTVRVITIADWPIKHPGQDLPLFICVKKGYE